MVSLGKYSIFKNSTWPWKKSFSTDFLMATQVRLLKISGMWPVNWFYCLFVDFWIVQIAIYYYATFVIELMNQGSITDITDALTSAVIYSWVSFGAIYFQFYYKECERMIEFMKAHFKMRSATGLTYVTTEPTYLIAKRLTVIWMCMGMSSAVHVAIYPITVMKRQMPLNCLYPFEYSASPLFEIIYLSQCFAQVTVAFVYTLSGMFLLSLVMLTCGQYDIIFCSLKNIRYTGLMQDFRKNRKNLIDMQDAIDLNDEELNQYFYSYERKESLVQMPILVCSNDSTSNEKKTIKRRQYASKDTYLMEYNDEIFDALKACIAHHQKLLTFCSYLESFFHPLVLFKSLQTTSQICSLAFVSSKTNDSSFLVIINKIEYLFLTFLELFIFGYSGENLKIQSTRLGEAILRSSWYLCGGPVRRGILLILSNTLNASVLTGGKFFVLDYMKVKGIMAAAFSYYTLLEQL